MLDAELRQLKFDAAAIVTAADKRLGRLHAEYITAAEAVSSRELRVARLLGRGGNYGKHSSTSYPN